MKKTFKIAVLYFTFIGSMQAQTASVEKKVTGIQVGFLGAWVHQEYKITNLIALRAEVGMNVGLFGGGFYEDTGYVITPVITVEPRWYYNLKERQSNSKKIKGNTGNYVSLQTSFHPNGFAISNYDNVEIVNQLSIIPTWGIKRVVGKHFCYESGIGLGKRYYYADTGTESFAAINLHLRLGHQF
jgi:hypothetical protein